MFHVAKLCRIISAASFFLSDDDDDIVLTYFLSNLGQHIPKLLVFGLLGFFCRKIAKVVERVFPISLHGYV